VTRFMEALNRFRGRWLSANEAGELLGVSGRQFRRLCVRFEGEGLEGLRDRRLGRMCGMYWDRYADFSVKRFHGALVREHGYTLCCTVTHLSLQSAGLVAKAAVRGKHRKRRERQSLPGMLLFPDGSTHCWLPGTEVQQDLILTLDDATGHITSMFLAAEEGTMSSFQGLSGIM
jgi:Helix-turn-helix domain